jgi:hypothetical protein
MAQSGAGEIIAASGGASGAASLQTLGGTVTLLPTRRKLFVGVGAAMLAPGLARASNSTVEIDIDVSNAPQLADWGAQLRAMMLGWWPLITAALASPGYAAPDKVKVAFRDISPPNVGAFTHGDTITVNLSDIQAHPTDFGRVAHEMVHIVQAYPQPTIQWLMEGIADYLRYYVLLPQDPMRGFDPSRFTYQLGYQPAAALLDWVERKYGAGSVRRINAAMRQGGDGEAELLKITGATPMTLWRAYLASLRPLG